jgi:hypothetical protein
LQDFVKKIEREALGLWLFKEGMILFNGRIYLLPASDFIISIIKESHSSTHKDLHKSLLVSGFSGFYAKKPTRTEQNLFGLNRFLVRSGLY